MTDPRWTPRGDGNSHMYYGPEAGPIRVDIWDLHDFSLNESDDLRHKAWDALVAAVRDADILRQAREILAEIVGDDDCWYDHHGYCQAHGWLQEGVCPHKRARALLSSPVSPDTTTPTGQTPI